MGASTYRYACRPRSDGGCGGTAVSGEWIDREAGELALAALALRPDGPTPEVWARQAELDALTARRDALESRWRKGHLDDEVFFRNSTALERLLKEMHAERAAWQTVQAVFNDGLEERRRRWALPAERGGYDLAQRRALVSSALATVLVFPVGKGNRQRSRDSILPVLKVI
ncbi:hypothetical protein ACFY4C_17385 [Actinomadura viridis]|uniref:hypothetical protein n=1 Tax=Actinomadura viridis TaxID=58110 RepID=UPI003691A2D7